VSTIKLLVTRGQLHARNEVKRDKLIDVESDAKQVTQVTTKNL